MIKRSKKLLAMILTLCMVLTLIPAIPASAESSGIWELKVDYPMDFTVKENDIDKMATEKWAWYPNGNSALGYGAKTFVMNGMQHVVPEDYVRKSSSAPDFNPETDCTADPDFALRLPPGSTIIVNGKNNKIGNMYIKTNSHAIVCDGALTIKGSGELQAIGPDTNSYSCSVAVKAYSLLVDMPGGTLNANAGNVKGYSIGLWLDGSAGNVASNLTINNGTVNATAWNANGTDNLKGVWTTRSCGVYMQGAGTLTMDGGTLNAYSTYAGGSSEWLKFGCGILLSEDSTIDMKSGSIVASGYGGTGGKTESGYAVRVIEKTGETTFSLNLNNAEIKAYDSTTETYSKTIYNWTDQSYTFPYTSFFRVLGTVNTATRVKITPSLPESRTLYYNPANGRMYKEASFTNVISNVSGWSADSEGVLTLNNFDYSSVGDVALYLTKNTTLNLVGNNKINVSDWSSNGSTSCGINIANGVTVNVIGTGTLETRGLTSGVSSVGVFGNANAKLVLESGKLIAAGGELLSGNSSGIDVPLEIKGGEVVAKGNAKAFNKTPVISGDFRYRSGDIDELDSWRADFSAMPTDAKHVEIVSTKACTVTYNANGGTVTTETAETGENGKLTGLPTPEARDGITFKGWYTAASGGTEVTTNTVFADDTTIYAQWEIAGAPFTITFHANSGTVKTATMQTGKDGRLKEQPTAQKRRYALEGWYTAAEGGQKITETTEFKADTTVYAHWEKAATRTETLDLRSAEEDILDSDEGWKWYYNGTSEYKAKTLVIDELDLRTLATNPEDHSIKLPGDSTLVIKGENWISTEGFNQDSLYADGYLVIKGDGILNIFNKDRHCVTAKYDITQRSGTLNLHGAVDKTIQVWSGSYMMNGGVLEGMSESTNPFHGLPMDMPTYTCWVNTDMVSPGGAGSKSFEQSADYRYVKYICDYTTNTVRFDAFGGSVEEESLNTNINGKLSVLPTPTKASSIFKGWFTDAELGTEITVNTVFTESTTVYARWEVAGAPFIITLNAEGGTVDPTRVITNKAGILSSLPTPQRAGKMFIGWFTINGNEITKDTLITANTTVYAEWADYTRLSALDMGNSSLQYNNGSEIVTANPNETDILDSAEGWKWYLNAADGYDNKTLVLENCYLKERAQFSSGIITKDGMTIVLAGVNIIEGWYGISANGDLKIKGDGTLNIINNLTGINGGTITMENGIVNIRSNLYAVDCVLTFKGGMLTLKGYPAQHPYKTVSMTAPAKCWTNTTIDPPGGSGSSTYTANPDIKYVRFAVGSYTLYNVSFDANSELNNPADMETGGNGKLLTLPQLKRSGYVFNGWYTSENGGTEVTTDTIYTDDTTVYAHWTAVAVVPEAFIIAGGQTGKLTYGTGSSVTYNILSDNFTNPVFAPSVEWSGTAPVGVTASFNADKTLLTLTSTAAANAGTYKFKIVSGTAGNKVESAENELVIDKANYTPVPAKTINVKVVDETAQTGTVTAADFFATLPSGAEITGCTVKTGGTNVVSEELVLNEGSISFTGKTELDANELPANDVYNITIISNNYNDIVAKLTFKAVAKTPVTISGVSVSGKTYNGSAVNYTGAPVSNDGTANVVPSGYTYEWQNANGDTLASAPKDAGSYKLIVSVQDGDANYTGTTEIDFTINQAQITITAANKTAKAGEAAPAYTYTVAGLVSGETLKTAPTLSCTPNMNTAGTYPITASGAVVPDGGNYKANITYVNGTLTVQAVQVVNTFVAATNITGVPTKGTVGTALTLTGTATPTSATNKTITWKVKDKGTTGAVLKNGKLTFTGSGTAVVTATVKNGKTATTDFTKNFTITVAYPISKGKTYEVSGMNYKVTSITNSKKEVTFMGLTSAKKKSATTVTVGNTVKIKGFTLNVTAIGSKALNKNTKVKTIKIGDKVLTIGDAAFSGCTALTSITIGKGLKTLGKEVFNGDKKLKTITIKSTQLSKVGKNAAKNVKATIKVPAAKVAAYKKLFKTYKNIKVTK